MYSFSELNSNSQKELIYLQKVSQIYPFMGYTKGLKHLEILYLAKEVSL